MSRSGRRSCRSRLNRHVRSVQHVRVGERSRFLPRCSTRAGARLGRMGWRYSTWSRIGRGGGTACLLVACTACGASHHSTATTNATVSSSASARSSGVAAPATSSRSAVAEPHRTRLIAVLPAARRTGLFGWMPAVAVRGQTAVWISRVKAYHEHGFTITLLRLEQRLVALALHAGGSQPGGEGWRYGDAIRAGERRIVVAAFNSGFQESYGAGGFVEGGRVGWPLRRGAASVVIYREVPPMSAGGRRRSRLGVARWRPFDRTSACLSTLGASRQQWTTASRHVGVIRYTSSRSSPAQLSASRPGAI